MQSRTTSRLLLLAAAVLFSTGGAAIKAATLTSWQVAAFRSLIAAAALWLLVPAARRGWNRRVVPVAAAYSATLVLFVLANKLTTSANAIFLQDTAPLYLLLMGPLLLHERIRRSDLVLMSAVAAGMALFFVGREPAVATAPDPWHGNILGALSGIAWAGTIGGLRWLERHPEGKEASMPTVIAGNLLAFLICLPEAVPVARVTALDAAVMVYLGVFQIGLAYRCVTRAMRDVPAFEASTLLLLEPALNPIWTWLVHGERPSHWALAGGALILAATFGNAWWQSRAGVAAGAAGFGES